MQHGGRVGRWVQVVALIAAGLALYGCATLGTLGTLVRPLRIEAARERPAELRLGGGGFGGGRIGLPDAATLRLWARIENPNPFGLTLSAIDGTVYLEDARAASVDFPLGLALEPRLEQVVPLDITLRLSDLPGLGGVLGRAVSGNPMAYRLEGRITLDAGALGQPTFGPSTLLRGEVRALR
jgi:hypothetical protein